MEKFLKLIFELIIKLLILPVRSVVVVVLVLTVVAEDVVPVVAEVVVITKIDMMKINFDDDYFMMKIKFRFFEPAEFSLLGVVFVGVVVVLVGLGVVVLVLTVLAEEAVAVVSKVQ